MRSCLTILTIIFITGCASQHKFTAGEGYINVKGGKVFYSITGEGTKPPILLLHGGPGGTSHYLYPLKTLSKDRSVIILDQLGSGKSDRINDTSLMTIENYVTELKQFRKKLHLKKYYLYGHSWGTMLGVDFYLKYPKGIIGIVFNSPLFSTDCWIKDADTLIAALPDDIQSAIRLNEARKTYNDPGYQHAVSVYYSHYMHVTPYRPEDRDTTNSFFAENIYQYMWGPSEFTATGNLKNYNRLKDLKKIKVPVLLICGDHDEARTNTVKYFQSLIPNADFVEIKNAGHGTLHDNPVDNLDAIKKFLDRLDVKQ